MPPNDDLSAVAWVAIGIASLVVPAIVWYLWHRQDVDRTNIHKLNSVAQLHEFKIDELRDDVDELKEKR